MEEKETFYRKNDLGVRIEYTVIGYLKEKHNYMIYTDFMSDKSNQLGITIYVDKEVDGKYIPVDDEERKSVIKSFNKEILNANRNRKG